MSAHPPRACLHCFEVKEPDAFDMGPSGFRRRGVCRDCVAREAAEREQRLAARRTTWRDPQTGQMVRHCKRCDRTLPLTSAHFAWADRAHTTLQWWCRTCAGNERAEAHRRKMASDPEYAERWRARERANKAQQRAKFPERVREAQARYVRRVKADPHRAAEARAADRRQYAARAARRGREITPRGPRLPAPGRGRQSGLLPVGPLLRAVEHALAATDRTQRELCIDLGIDPRKFRGWQTGEFPNVSVEVADRVITRLGRLWFDVFDEDEFPEAHAKAEAVFG